MALRFADSFDHYATANILKKWTSISSTPLIGAYGRNGTNGLRIDGDEGVSLTLDARATWIVGGAFKINLLGSTRFLFTLKDGATFHVGLGVRADGVLGVFRANNSTELANSGAFALSVGGMYYIEFKCTIGDTGVGAYEVRVDGTARIGPTAGADTRNGGNATANIVSIETTGSVTAYDVDDVYICDTSGSVNNDFLGDVQVKCVLPTAAGATTNFTPSVGANYECVDDATLDEANYNSSSTVNHVDTFVFGDIPAAGTVKGVQVWGGMQKSDTDPRSAALMVRPDATDHAGASQTLATSWLGYREIFETNPDTSAAWSPAAVNATEFGYKVAA